MDICALTRDAPCVVQAAWGTLSPPFSAGVDLELYADASPLPK